jgi:hypothetical protein
MSERRKPELLWPWTIRAIAVALPIIYVVTFSGGFNPASGPSPRALSLLGFVAIAACLLYRSKVK